MKMELANLVILISLEDCALYVTIWELKKIFMMRTLVHVIMDIIKKEMELANLVMLISQEDCALFVMNLELKKIFMMRIPLALVMKII